MALDGHVISVEQRIRNRRDHAFAARLSRDAVEAVFASVGGAGLSLNQPIQRMWACGAMQMPSRVTSA